MGTLEKQAGIGKRPQGIQSSDDLMKKANIGGRPKDRAGKGPKGLGGRQYDHSEPHGGNSVKDGKVA